MHVRSLLAGVGVAAVAVTVPLVVVSTASADNTGPSPTGASCPGLEGREAVKDFLTAHPDVATEVQALRKLPADQRAAARKQYLAAHPDVATEFRQVRQDRRGTWAEVAGQAAAELQKYPAVQALIEDLGRAPAGQRAAEARTYLAAHPDAKTQLKQLRGDTRTRLQSCRAGK